MQDIKSLVDKYAEWDKLQKEAKDEIDKIKLALQAEAERMMEDKKIKQVEFWGSSGSSKAVITDTATVKILYPEVIKKVLGDIAQDALKEKPVSYEPNEHFKRVITVLFENTYAGVMPGDVIRQTGADAAVSEVLSKKLKGTWKKDVDIFMKVAGMTRDNAEHFAYCYKDALDFEKLVGLLECAGYQYGSEEYNTAIRHIKDAAGVEKTMKIGIEYKDEDSGS